MGLAEKRRLQTIDLRAQSLLSYLLGQVAEPMK
jgi:hypothetical protein